MENKRVYLLLFFCLLCPVAKLLAQEVGDEVYIKERPEGHKLNLPVKSNDCLKYYSNQEDSTHPKFKSVTLTKYAYKDTTYRGKRFESKEKTTFNKMGEQLFYLKTDSIGIDDSMRFFYDDRYNKIREVNYNRNDSGHMVNNTDNTWEFDEKGRLIKNHTRTNIGLYNAIDDIEETKYYRWGSELHDRSIDGKDTTIELIRYDTNGLEIYDEKNSLKHQLFYQI